MLPMLAMMVAGFMAQGSGRTAARQQQPAGGGLGDLVGGLLGGLTGGNGAARGGASAGLASMLDMDGDGNPLDDILEMIGKATR
jgi:predicted lipid-binding transport protein (Tim44 family)